VKKSDLECVTRQGDALVVMPRIDPDMFSSLAGLDPNLISSVTKTIAEINTPNLLGAAGLKAAADLMRPMVAPQIGEALKVFTPQMSPSFAEARKAIDSSLTLQFAKTLEEISATQVIQGRVAESLRALSLPPSFTASMATAMRDLPRIQSGNLLPKVHEAAEETVALAEVEDVAAVIDESVGLIAGLSPAQRRNLALDVAVLIGAYVIVVACLAEGGHGKLAGALLAYAVALTRVYWRLTRKLD
jgi:hypothetical protein